MSAAARCPHDTRNPKALAGQALSQPGNADASHAYLRSIAERGLEGAEPVALTELPFAPLSPLSAEAAQEVEAQALALNDRYLEIIERYSFCPYAKFGRLQRRTRRYIYHADSPSLEGLFALMAHCAADRTQEVVQVIMPRLQVRAEVWTAFCHAATATGHARMGGPDVLACAPLHPELAFGDETAFSLVPLFRRAPQPTIQWVRLDVLSALYEGHAGEDRYVDVGDLSAIKAYLERAAPVPLYDKVCWANAKLVERLGLDAVVAMLADVAAEVPR